MVAFKTTEVWAMRVIDHTGPATRVNAAFRTMHLSALCRMS